MITATLRHLTPDAEARLAWAMRQCYNSFRNQSPESDGARIRSCIADGHHDTLRHAFASVDITAEAKPTHLITLGYLSDRYRYLDRTIIGWDDDLHAIIYRYTGNLQTWREVLLGERPNWGSDDSSLNLALDGVLADLQWQCPNVFGDGAPVGAWNRQPLMPAIEFEGGSVELWFVHSDPYSRWHGYATFKITCDKATAIQIDRHNFDGILRFSQRYVDQGKVRRHYPERLFDGQFGWDVIDLDQRALTLYRAMTARGTDGKRLVRLEDARYVTNMAWETTAFITGRLPIWLNFIEQRDHPAAQEHTAQRVGAAVHRLFAADPVLLPMVINHLPDRWVPSRG